jgi:hypothetical protein
MRKITAVLAAAVVLTVGGCGGNDKAASSSGSTTAQPSAPTTSCALTASDELYVSQMFDCADRGTRVYTFADKAARDNYWTAASAVGSVKVSEGETWLEVKA